MKIRKRQRIWQVVLGVTIGGLAYSSHASAAVLEKPLTKPASEVTGTSATLNGVLNPKASATASYHFAYGNGGRCEGNATELSQELTGKAIKVKATVTGLVPHTVYTFCVIATNAAKEESTSAARTFETLPVGPAIEEQSASSITRTTASLTALVNPESQATVCKAFQYVANAPFEEGGFESAKEAACEPEELGSGTSGERTGASVLGLIPNTVYDYRVVAENASGVSEGEDHTFLTLPNPPLVTTGGSSAVTSSSATISGLVDPGSVGPNSDARYFFEYGPDTSYGSTTPLEDAGQGESPIVETADLTSLRRDAIYHYRIVAISDNTNSQVVDGNDQTFMTGGPPPVVSGLSVSAVTQGSALITVSLDSEGLPTRYELQLGVVPGALQSVASGNTATTLPLALSIGGLSPGTTYRFRLVATNINRSVASPQLGEDAFMTAPGSAASPLLQPATPQLLPIPRIAFPQESPVGVLGSKAKRLTTAQKLASALKKCRARTRKLRPACERAARRRYRPSTRPRKR